MGLFQQYGINVSDLEEVQVYFEENDTGIIEVETIYMIGPEFDGYVVDIHNDIVDGTYYESVEDALETIAKRLGVPLDLVSEY